MNTIGDDSRRVHSIGSAVKCAVKSVWNEVHEFSFNDPYEVDSTGADRDSLCYPVYSRKLRWAALRMDSTRVPRTWMRTTGTIYSPVYIAWYSLVQLGDHHRTKLARHLDCFITQLDWLERNATLRDDGAVVWESRYDYRQDGIVLRSPWTSAFHQRLAISAVVRGWRITKSPGLL
jgi:hypothetical protein